MEIYFSTTSSIGIKHFKILIILSTSEYKVQEGPRIRYADKQMYSVACPAPQRLLETYAVTKYYCCVSNCHLSIFSDQTNSEMV